MPNARSSLQCTVVGRDSRRVVVESELTRERIALEDRTGDVELLLGLLRDGRTREAAVAELTAHREGVAPVAVWSAIDALTTLGLVRDGEAEPLRAAA